MALIPAYEEDDRVGTTVAALLGSGAVDEVIVVDDGSTDHTGETARRAGAAVIRLEQNQGKGAALTVAARTLMGRSDTPAVVLLADADLGSSAPCLAGLVTEVRAGRGDLAIAVPPPAGTGGGFGLVVRAARGGLYRLTGRRFAAPLSGSRAVSGTALPWLVPFGRGFGMEVQMTADAIERGLRVVELPADVRHASTGRTLAGFRHRARQGRDVVAVLLRARWRRLAKRHSPAPPRPAER